MKTSLMDVPTGVCPYCDKEETAAGCDITVLNSMTGDRMVECVCGNQYFVTEVTDV
ncbi:MAG: hypothetical protein ACYTBJ_00605 [Planctomycetota bacterium]|jgi:hypothetical protein